MLDAEVFPVERNRWIVVIKSPEGDFSTEATSAEQVPTAVRDALVEVLGEPIPEHRLVDVNGLPWDLAVAVRQAGFLDR